LHEEIHVANLAVGTLIFERATAESATAYLLKATSAQNKETAIPKLVNQYLWPYYRTGGMTNTVIANNFE
jgi:hypothetical protein